MYVGQSREGFIPQKYASPSKNPSTAYKLKVTLRSITPNLYANPAEIKIFDDEIAYSMPCLCGDRVAFDVNIKRINGEVMYDSVKVGRKVSMQLGDLAYPMLFSYALFNKVPGGMRTVLSQGKYLRSLAVSNINRIFQKDQLPKDEFFIVEFSNISM
jgi:hypothetical protein